MSFLAFLGFLLLAGSGLAMSLSSLWMQSEVNDNLEPEERYSYWIQWLGKSIAIMSLHRQFFPESTLRKIFGWSLTTMIGSLALLGFTGQL